MFLVGNEELMRKYFKFFYVGIFMDNFKIIQGKIFGD